MLLLTIIHSYLCLMGLPLYYQYRMVLVLRAVNVAANDSPRLYEAVDITVTDVNQQWQALHKVYMQELLLAAGGCRVLSMYSSTFF